MTKNIGFVVKTFYLSLILNSTELEKLELVLTKKML